MVKKYIPQKGDIILLDFNQQSGHEQAGYRPALVISPKIYNAKMGLSLVCPITSKQKGFGFETPLGPGGKIQGTVLSDQLKSVDWKVRKAKFVEKADPKITQEVVEKVLPIII